MRMRIASLLALGVLVSMTLSAQTKISGTLSCAKPDPMQSIEPRRAGTVMNLAKVQCTWPKTFDSSRYGGGRGRRRCSTCRQK